MSQPIKLALVLAASIAGAAELRAQDAPALYIEDGQLIVRPVVIFVTTDIPPDANVALHLNSDTHHQHAETKILHRYRNQVRTIPNGGLGIQRSGTLIFADISRNKAGGPLMPWWKPMMRVRVALSWDEGGERRTLVSERDVNLGHHVGAWFWTALLVAGLLGLLVLLSRGETLRYLCGPDGRLSLSLTQMALWTLAIGSLVVAHGMTRLEVPEIPRSLLALMGLAVVTGGVSYMQTAKQSGAGRLRWSDLVCDVSSGERVFSFSRAQMLFWTGLMLVLFISKTVVDGALWAVPWEMVALMGLSQAGYVVPKAVPKAPGDLEYNVPAPSYPLGKVIVDNVPRSIGGKITKYTVRPPLPAGLILDPESGAIRGTPTEGSRRTEYTIDGTNNAGSTSTVVTITVA